MEMLRVTLLFSIIKHYLYLTFKIHRAIQFNSPTFVIHSLKFSVRLIFRLFPL